MCHRPEDVCTGEWRTLFSKGHGWISGVDYHTRTHLDWGVVYIFQQVPWVDHSMVWINVHMYVLMGSGGAVELLYSSPEQDVIGKGRRLFDKHPLSGQYSRMLLRPHLVHLLTRCVFDSCYLCR